MLTNPQHTIAISKLSTSTLTSTSINETNYPLSGAFNINILFLTTISGSDIVGIQFNAAICFETKFFAIIFQNKIY